MNTTCSSCGKPCTPGVDATFQTHRRLIVFQREEAVCDTCAGVVRTPRGYAMDPYEQEHGMVMVDVKTGEHSYIPPIR